MYLTSGIYGLANRSPDHTRSKSKLDIPGPSEPSIWFSHCSALSLWFSRWCTLRTGSLKAEVRGHASRIPQRRKLRPCSSFGPRIRQRACVDSRPIRLRKVSRFINGRGCDGRFNLTFNSTSTLIFAGGRRVTKVPSIAPDLGS